MLIRHVELREFLQYGIANPIRVSADGWIDGDHGDERGEKIGFCNGVLEKDLEDCR